MIIFVANACFALLGLSRGLLLQHSLFGTTHTQSGWNHSQPGLSTLPRHNTTDGLNWPRQATDGVQSAIDGRKWPCQTLNGGSAGDSGGGDAVLGWCGRGVLELAFFIV